MAADSELLKQLEDDIANNRLVLPTLPEVALRVRKILEGDWSVPQLAKEIESDPGLAARLMKVANSSLYRPSRTIEDINGAIARLGRNLIQSLVTQLAMLQSMQCYSSALSGQVQDVNQHCLEVGAICRTLAKKHTGLSPELAMLAGLVHDIGKLPLFQRLAKLGHSLNDRSTMATVQQLHPRIGALILETWKFPPEVVIAARDHGDHRRNSPVVDFADLVIVGNLQYHRSRGTAPYAQIEPHAVPALRKFGVPPEELLKNQLGSELREALEGFLA